MILDTSTVSHCTGLRSQVLGGGMQRMPPFWYIPLTGHFKAYVSSWVAKRKLEERKVNRLGESTSHGRETLYFSTNILFTNWNGNSSLKASLSLVVIIFTSKLLSLIVIVLCSYKTSCSKKLKIFSYILIQLDLKSYPGRDYCSWSRKF